MATLLGALSYRLKDAEGIIYNHDVFFTFADSAALTAVEAFAAAYAGVLDGLTECQIIKQTLRVVLGTSGLKSAPVADSDGQETLLLNFALATSFYSYGDDIPGELDAVIVNGRVDLTNTALAAYTTFMTAAHSGFTPTNEFGEAIAAVNSGAETFRKKRKQLNSRSKTLA
jgi:hypothetical protein